MKPRTKDVLHFVGWTSRSFAKWLRDGLEGYLINKEGIGKFRPLEYCIAQEHTLWGDLAEVYSAFPQDQQAHIREAIAILLKELPAEQKYAKIFRELLCLAEAVGAKEVLKAIPPAGQGFLALEPEDPDARPLNDVAAQAMHFLNK